MISRILPALGRAMPVDATAAAAAVLNDMLAPLPLVRRDGGMGGARAVAARMHNTRLNKPTQQHQLMDDNEDTASESASWFSFTRAAKQTPGCSCCVAVSHLDGQACAQLDKLERACHLFICTKTYS